MPRAIWKGAISFGLVHVPVGLYAAASESGVDFDWLDRRSMDAVGYKRVNKRTGKEVPREDIVRGVKTQAGDYVVLTDDEIRAAYPKTTQTIEIEAFVAAPEVSPVYLDRPYYLEPAAKSEKVYALLREAMTAAGVIGIARIVMHTKEHLAALAPAGAGLVLNTLRWPADIRAMDDLTLPSTGAKGAQLKDAELRMAKQLIGDMTTKWDPKQYADRFTQSIHALVEKRAKAGKTETIEPFEEETPSPSNVIDLTELLRKSLGERKGSARTVQAKPVAKGAVKKAAKVARPAAKAAPKAARKTAPRKAA
jgi:DNA end-binding protein Ku